MGSLVSMKEATTPPGCLGLPIWLFGYLCAALVCIIAFYGIGIAANYNTMVYVNDGYDPADGSWNPSPPLKDRLLPSSEWLESHLDWLLSKPCGIDYMWARDFPFSVISIVGQFLPCLFGRMDIMWHTTLVMLALSLGKFVVGVTFQTPPAQGQRLAVYELGGMETVLEWRNGCHSPSWKEYFGWLLGMGSSHAADMIYSGHTFNGLNLLRAGIWTLSEARIPHQRCWYWSFTVLSGLLFSTGMAIMILTRGHYSFDMLLASLLWFLFTRWPYLRERSECIAAYFTGQGEREPPSVEGCFRRASEAAGPKQVDDKAV